MGIPQIYSSFDNIVQAPSCVGIFFINSTILLDR